MIKEFRLLLLTVSACSPFPCGVSRCRVFVQLQGLARAIACATATAPDTHTPLTTIVCVASGSNAKAIERSASAPVATTTTAAAVAAAVVPMVNLSTRLCASAVIFEFALAAGDVWMRAHAQELRYVTRIDL